MRAAPKDFPRALIFWIDILLLPLFASFFCVLSVKLQKPALFELLCFKEVFEGKREAEKRESQSFKKEEDYDDDDDDHHAKNTRSALLLHPKLVYVFVVE